MTKEQALNEYMAALKTALEKHRQYTYYYFKESNKALPEELLNAYHSSVECVYSEYNKASFISKWLWKKRLREQFRNIQQFYIKYIVLAPRHQTRT